MTQPDLNLLYVMHAVLAERNVTRAGQRLGLSPSAMSRALGRLRKATGDPLLVKSGRCLIPTDRALELSQLAEPLVSEAVRLLQPVDSVPLDSVERIFTIRSSLGFAESFGPQLISAVAESAPGVIVSMTERPDRDTGPLREGKADLDIGIERPPTDNDTKLTRLFPDRFVGIVREGHPFAQKSPDIDSFTTARHIVISCAQSRLSPVDEALALRGSCRTAGASVGEFSTALALARGSDFVVSAPETITAALRHGLRTFELPFVVPAFGIAMYWHSRSDSDPVHSWLRETLLEVCRNGV